MQAAFARHLRDIGRAYPAARDPHVVLVIDNAPWHHGGLITQVLDQRFTRMHQVQPPDRMPQLQVIERCWKVWRRRATHNRLFPTQARLKQTLRNSLCYDQTLKHRVLSLIQSSNSSLAILLKMKYQGK
jgi:hypothetical protein